MTSNRPHNEGIRYRAYFLWKNRTGTTWWDAVANWLEAERTEASRCFHPVQRTPSWMFTVHFTQMPTVGFSRVGSWSERAVLRCNTDDVCAIRTAFQKIAAAASSYDVVCGFACGAAPLLIHVARTECHRLFGAQSPHDDAHLSVLQGRLHLFPGLSWGDESEIPFLEFLSSVSPTAKILVIDCSFTGGAIAAIANAVVNHSAGSRVSIHAIVEKEQIDQDKIANAQLLAAEGRIGGLSIEYVPNLLAEDVPELIGYDSFQATSKLLAESSPGVIVVRESTTGRYLVQASRPLHTTFDALIDGRLGASPDDFAVEESELQQKSAETLYAVLRDRLEHEYSRVVNQPDSMNSYARLIKRRDLCGRWRKETLAIAHKFNVSVDAPPPSFCESIRLSKKVLNGDEHRIEIANTENGAVVSILSAFRDDGEVLREDYSFVLLPDDLLRAQNDRLDLETSVPKQYKESFECMWAQVPDDAKQALRQQWGEQRDSCTQEREDEIEL